MRIRGCLWVISVSPEKQYIKPGIKKSQSNGCESGAGQNIPSGQSLDISINDIKKQGNLLMTKTNASNKDVITLMSQLLDILN